MRIIKLLLILTTFISNNVFGQAAKKKELEPDLIGIWEFVELRDNKGVKIDTIWHSIPGLEKKGWEIPKGPLLIYNADGTYSKQFTPQNNDIGKWYYDNKKKEIIQILLYKEPYNTATLYLIDKNHAKLDENGDYYEIITGEVVELTNEKLIILEREDRQRTFKKKKKNE